MFVFVVTEFDICCLSMNREHEPFCDFKPVSCPNSSICGHLLKKVCPHIRFIVVRFTIQTVTFIYRN